MPWAPAEAEAHDPRLDPFRDRAGVVLDEVGQEVAVVFLRAETSWQRRSGHLWWSTWSPPQEAVHVWLQDDSGRVTERISVGPDLERDLAEWTRDVLTTADGTYRVTWLDDEESSQVRAQTFGPED